MKDDPAMAGQRKVAHRALFSVESEMLTGSEAVANINSSLPINKNRALNHYLTGLVEQLASPAHTDSVARCHIYVIDSPMILVFSVPGGYLYVSTGALAQADDEGEAAALLVHDIAHFACRHWAKKVSVAMMWRFVEVPTLFFAPWAVTAAMPFPVRNSLLQKYVDTDLAGAEKEADGLGVQYLYRSGYDPKAYLQVFRKMGGYINQNSDRCVPGIMCCFPSEERLNRVKTKMELYPQR